MHAGKLGQADLAATPFLRSWHLPSTLGRQPAVAQGPLVMHVLALLQALCQVPPALLHLWSIYLLPACSIMPQIRVLVGCMQGCMKAGGHLQQHIPVV